jgi:hypothetical protein
LSIARREDLEVKILVSLLEFGFVQKLSESSFTSRDEAVRMIGKMWFGVEFGLRDADGLS